MSFLTTFLVSITGLSILVAGIILYFIRDKYGYPPSITYLMMGFGITILILAFIINIKEKQRMAEYLAQQKEIENKQKEKKKQDERLDEFIKKAEKQAKIVKAETEKEKARLKEQANKEIAEYKKKIEEGAEKSDKKDPEKSDK